MFAVRVGLDREIELVEKRAQAVAHVGIGIHHMDDWTMLGGASRHPGVHGGRMKEAQPLLKYRGRAGGRK
jgi:hypothetical protein